LTQQLGFLPGLKEILTRRQVHALEHATVWLLTQNPQRHLTTAILLNLAIHDISTERDLLGRSAPFVRLAWIEQ